MPTPKAKSIEDLLTKLTGISRQDAHNRSICPICKTEIKAFRDMLSRIEYSISGMCQLCQDEVWK